MDLLSQINEAIANLYWVSEIDELWKAMVLDREPNKEAIAKLSGKSPVKTKDFNKFFANATKEQDWHDEDEKADVQQYQQLVKLLQENLEAIAVYVAGDVEMDIFVTGRTKTREWIALKTMAVGT